MLIPNTKGFSLIELLITLTIISLLLFIALPSQHHELSEKKFEQAVAQLLEVLRIARQEALARGMVVTLCPYTDEKCGEDWTQGVMMFEDETASGDIVDETAIIARHPFYADQLRIFFNAFPSGTNTYLQFAGNGFTRYQNGSFYYCPESKNLIAVRIVVNQAGRAYVTRENAAEKCHEK